MKILLLHLSDIHLVESANEIMSRIDAISYVVASTCVGMDGVAICVSGDVAYSGKVEQYGIAKTMVQALYEQITSLCKCPVSMIVCPGNHDCDFDAKGNEVRTVLVNKVKSDHSLTANEEIVDQCVAVQQSFWSWHRDTTKNMEVLADRPLTQIYRWTLGGKDIYFQCFNTAWISVLHENQADLVFPIDLIADMSATIPSDSLTVGLLHHPPSWFHPTVRRDIIQYLEHHCDLVLMGHEHLSDTYTLGRGDGNITGFIDGALLQDSGGEKCEFNLVFVDLAESRYRCNCISWSESNFVGANSDAPWISFANSRKHGGASIRLSVEWRNYIDDPGANYKHPEKSSLTLEDLYVPPDMQELKISFDSLKKREPVYVRAEDAILDSRRPLRVVVFGEDLSGKTALCKIVYKVWLSEGKVPIWIRGEDINSTSPEDFEKIINKAYQAQYADSQLDEFRHWGADKNLIIVDDFDDCRLNTKYKTELLRRIASRYQNLLITASMTFRLEEFMGNDESTDSTIIELNHYRLMEFNYTLRGKLIEKWIGLARRELISEEQYWIDFDDAKLWMDRLAGRSIVPSYPLFLYAVLQMREGKSTQNLKISAYAQYFDVLLFDALRKVFSSPDDIDAAASYLSELARYMRQHMWSSMSLSQLREFHKWYVEAFKLTDGFELQINKLEESLIYLSVDGQYCFRYRYVYYFYLARSLSTSLAEEETQKLIVQMAENIHVRENANVLMFLTYHTKDPFVIRQIVSAVSRIFHDLEPIKLETDVDGFNQLLSEAPELMMQGMKLLDYRDEALRKEESEYAKSREIDRTVEEANLTMSELELPGKINLAFKSMELLGQILSNYFGSLKGPVKFEICSEAYGVARRMLRALFNLVLEDIDPFVEVIKSWIEESRNVDEIDKEEIEKQARLIVFDFTSIMTFSGIAKLASSVGNEKIDATLLDVKKAEDCTATDLIDLAIRLRHYKSFPLNEMESINKAVKDKNVLAQTVLRYLVRHYLYMNPVNFKLRQRISSELAIKMSDQRLIDIRSQERRLN